VSAGAYDPADACQPTLTDERSSIIVDAVEEVQDLAVQIASDDPDTGLRAVAALRRLLERTERINVEKARRKGYSWQMIADELGVSKQAVHKKYAGKGRHW